MALQLYVQPRGGELIGQGIMQAAQGLAQGIERYYQRKEENERMEKASDFFMRAADANPEIARMFGIRDPKDKGAIKAGIKAVGGPVPFMQMGAAVQGMIEKQQAAELERKQRFALQDAADPIMQLANRQLTPEQFTSGQALGSNDFLRNAIAMGADPRMAAPVANVMQDTEIASLRAEAAAAKAATSNAYRTKEEAQAALKQLGGKGSIQQTEKGWIINAQQSADEVPLEATPFEDMGKDSEGNFFFFKIRMPDGRHTIRLNPAAKVENGNLLAQILRGAN